MVAAAGARLFMCASRYMLWPGALDRRVWYRPLGVGIRVHAADR